MKFLPLAYLFFGLSYSQKIRDLFHTKGGTLVSLYPDDCSYPCHHASNHKVGFTMTVDVDGTCLEKLDLDAELSSFFREEPCFPKVCMNNFTLILIHLYPNVDTLYPHYIDPFYLHFHPFQPLVDPFYPCFDPFSSHFDPF